MRDSRTNATHEVIADGPIDSNGVLATLEDDLLDDDDLRLAQKRFAKKHRQHLLARIWRRRPRPIRNHRKVALVIVVLIAALTIQLNWLTIKPAVIDGYKTTVETIHHDGITPSWNWVKAKF